MPEGCSLAGLEESSLQSHSCDVIWVMQLAAEDQHACQLASEV